MLKLSLRYCITTAVILLWLPYPFSYAQQSEFTAEEQAQLEELDAFLLQIEEDSVSIISMLDSLIKLEEEINRSQIILKTGYNNESLTNNRQSVSTENGIFSGLSYYHKSGVFLDLLSIWNSQYDPKRYLLVSSAGFMGNIGKNWSYMAGYDHYFFNDNAETEDIQFPFTDGLNAAAYFIKPGFETGIDYSIIFGDTFAAHRIAFSLTGNLSLNHVWFLDKVLFRPSTSLLLGNQSIYTLQINRRHPDPDRRFTYVENNTFGVMNISLLAPVYLRYKSFNLGLAYQFNFPQELEGEDLSYSSSNVFSASISYFIKL